MGEPSLVETVLTSGHEACLGETVLVKACVVGTVLVIGNEAGVVIETSGSEATLLKTGLADGSEAALVISNRTPSIRIRSAVIGAGTVELHGGRSVAAERMKIPGLRC